MKERITLIFGKTGCGKSYLASKLTAKENRLIIIDAMGEYKNTVVVTNFQDLYSYCTTHKNFRVSCRFTKDLDFEYTFKLIFALGNTCLLAEEAEIYISPTARQSNFLYLVRYGRHKNISIVGIARRASELSKDFRSQTHRIISFKQTDINDIQALEKVGLFDLDKLEGHNYKEVLL